MSSSDSKYFGVYRHDYANVSEALLFYLETSGGSAYTTAVSLAKLKVTYRLPDGSEYSTPGDEAIVAIHVGNGWYQVGIPDDALALPGKLGIRIFPDASEFVEIYGTADVRSDFDVHFAATYVPGSAGSDKLRGAISLHRWWDHVLVDIETGTTKDADLTALTLTVKDRAGVNYMSITDTDFAYLDDVAYFDEDVSGLAGGEVLRARVTGTYAGASFSQDFPLVSRFGA